jgi:hypothetical protein
MGFRASCCDSSCDDDNTICSDDHQLSIQSVSKQLYNYYPIDEEIVYDSSDSDNYDLYNSTNNDNINQCCTVINPPEDNMEPANLFTTPPAESRTTECVGNCLIHYPKLKRSVESNQRYRHNHQSTAK